MTKVRHLPTHRLSVKERDGNGRCVVGAGWLDENGSISIRLNPCVAITSHDDVIIMLFPVEKRRQMTGPRHEFPCGCVIDTLDGEQRLVVQCEAYAATGMVHGLLKDVLLVHVFAEPGPFVKVFGQ